MTFPVPAGTLLALTGTCLTFGYTVSDILHILLN